MFYSIPEQASFYPEIVNLLTEAEQVGFNDKTAAGRPLDTSCLLLFTIYEKMALERVVGFERCAHMMSSSKNSFMFR